MSARFYTYYINFDEYLSGMILDSLSGLNERSLNHLDDARFEQNERMKTSKLECIFLAVNSTSSTLLATMSL